VIRNIILDIVDIVDLPAGQHYITIRDATKFSMMPLHSLSFVN